MDDGIEQGDLVGALLTQQGAGQRPQRRDDFVLPRQNCVLGVAAGLRPVRPAHLNVMKLCAHPGLHS